MTVSGVHGFKGPMVVQDVPSVSTLGKVLLRAARYLNYPIKDYNDGYITGTIQNTPMSKS